MTLDKVMAVNAVSKESLYGSFQQVFKN